jgi:hypothetical protein
MILIILIKNLNKVSLFCYSYKETTYRKVYKLQDSRIIMEDKDINEGIILDELADEENENSQKDNEGTEDLVTILEKTDTAFRIGDESAGNLDYSPKDVFEDYANFN